LIDIAGFHFNDFEFVDLSDFISIEQSFFLIIIIYLGLVNECPEPLFKHSILGNYSLEKSNSSISNALNIHVFIKSYYLRP